ncbi:hypothetical protein O5343_27025, partial [Escherichia coli]|nr:hypothetical protein [Escherichia coli]
FSTNQNLIPGTNVLHFSARYKGHLTNLLGAFSLL